MKMKISLVDMNILCMKYIMIQMKKFHLPLRIGEIIYVNIIFLEKCILQTFLSMIKTF